MAKINPGFENDISSFFTEDKEKNNLEVRRFFSNSTHSNNKLEKRRFIKGLTLLTIICNLAFSSYLSLINSTTSFIPDNDIGIIGLTVSSAMEIFSAAILLSFVNNVWGVKRILVFNLFLGILFPLSFFNPTWYIFIPACVTKGISMVFLISNIYIYGSLLVYRYQQSSGGNLTVLLVLMSGLNNASVGAGYLWGNIIEYEVLETSNNRIFNASEISVCGSSYCNEDLSYLTVTKKPPKERFIILIGIYTGLSVLASLLSLLLEDLQNPSEKSESQTLLNCFIETTRSTLSLLKKPKGFLIILITMFIGVEQTFFITVFTYAYVNCTLGVAHVGNIMLVFGIVQIIISTCNYLLVKTLGRPLLIGIAFAGLISCFVTLLFIPLSTENGAIKNLTILTACYATVDSVALSIIFSVYGSLFEENVNGSYAVASFWWTTGALLCNLTNTFLCVATKLYILIGFAIISVSFYFYLEYLLHKDSFTQKIDRHRSVNSR